MLTGRPPWSDRSRKASKVLSYIKNSKESITVPENFSEECYDFVFNCCLQRDPKKRWSAEQLAKHPFLQKSPESEELQQSLGENRQSVRSEPKEMVNPNDIHLDISDSLTINVLTDNKVTSKVNSSEGRCMAAVPTPSVSGEAPDQKEEAKASEPPQELAPEGADKSCNFSRWSDTQFEDGTCSLSFLKLCKTEEERTRMKELERIKLENILKQQVKLKNSDSGPSTAAEAEKAASGQSGQEEL